MYARWFALIAVVAIVVFGLAGLAHTDAQDAKPKQEPEGLNPKIVPVLAIKPGETKEMLLSTACALVTRGRGLHFKAMNGEELKEVKDKVWKTDRLSLEFNTASELPYRTNKSEAVVVAERKVSLFIVKVTASADAKPGLIDLHVADATCSGTCATDVRVLILAK